MASGLRNVDRVRRLLRRVEPEIRSEIRGAVERSANAALREMKAGIPYGDSPPHLRDAVTRRIASDGLTARIGLLTKRRQRLHFYWRYLNYGTLKGIPAHQFLERSQELVRARFAREMAREVDRALDRVSRGR